MTQEETIQPKTRKSISWWKAGLWGGIGFLLSAPLALYFTISTFSLVEDNLRDWVVYIISGLILFAPAIITAISVAVYGNGKNHYYKTIGATLIALNIMLLLSALFYILIVAKPHTKGISRRDMQNLVVALPIFYSASIIASSFLWLVFGNSNKLRNQIQD